MGCYIKKLVTAGRDMEHPPLEAGEEAQPQKHLGIWMSSLHSKEKKVFCCYKPGGFVVPCYSSLGELKEN